jgi:hypothetical protein
MSQLDVVILFIYLITVTIILMRVFKSFDDVYKIEVVPEPHSIEDQLQEKNIQDLVGVKFDFENRYEFNKLETLSVSVTNKSQQHSIYVNWDDSSLTDFMGKSRRVVRVTPPGLSVDLFQPQAPSVIAPDRTLKEKITAEDVLEREGEGATLKIKSNPVIDIFKLQKGNKAEKKLYTDFTDFDKPLKLYMKLVMQLFDADYNGGGYRPYYLFVTFRLQQLPWYAGLPWNPKR